MLLELKPKKDHGRKAPAYQPADHHRRQGCVNDGSRNNPAADKTERLYHDKCFNILEKVLMFNC